MSSSIPISRKSSKFCISRKNPLPLKFSPPRQQGDRKAFSFTLFFLKQRSPFAPPLSLQSLTNFAQKSLSGNCEERQRWPLLLFLAPQSHFRESRKKIGKNEKFPQLQYSAFCGFPHTRERERERRPMQTHTFVSGKRK